MVGENIYKFKHAIQLYLACGIFTNLQEIQISILMPHLAQYKVENTGPYTAGLQWRSGSQILTVVKLYSQPCMQCVCSVCGSVCEGGFSMYCDLKNLTCSINPVESLIVFRTKLPWSITYCTYIL